MAGVMRIPIPSMSLGCMFKAQVIRNDGSVRYSGPWFTNTILNSGLDMFMVDAVEFSLDRSSFIGTCHIGEGSQTPDETDDSLYEPIVSTSSKTASDAEVFTDVTPAYKEFTATFEFGVGTFDSGSVNVREVGLGTGSNIINRQLFKDEDGSPVTISVQEDEGLRVSAKARVYLFEPATFTVSYDGQDISATITPITAILNNGILRYGRLVQNAISLSEDNSSFSTPSAISVDDYVPGTFERTATSIWSAGRFVGDLKYIRTGISYQRTTSSCRNYALIELAEPIGPISDTQEISIEWKRTIGRNGA